MHYFAYGSNMSLARLRARAPGVRRIGTCTLPAHSLRFHKLSARDGSAKCDAFFTDNAADAVIGALYEISRRDKGALDAVEGLGVGYDEKPVVVHDPAGQAWNAFTYCATVTDPRLLPYGWYLDHVIHGAREIQVPASYLRALLAVVSMEDPDRERDARERALYRRGSHL